MGVCSDTKCRYRSKEPNTRSTHRFPLNRPEILQMWIDNLGRKNFHPNRHSMICSKHFEEHCFLPKNEKSKYRKLRKDAVPTLFSQPEPSKRKPSFIWLPEDVPTITYDKISPNKFLRNRVINNHLTVESNEIISCAIKQEVNLENCDPTGYTTDKFPKINCDQEVNKEFLPLQIENIRSLNSPNRLPLPTTKLNNEIEIPENSLEKLTFANCNVQHSSIKDSLPNNILTVNCEKISIKEPQAPILKPGAKLRYIKVLPEALLTSRILMARGELDKAVIKIQGYRRELKMKNQKLRRLNKKVENLKDEIKDIQKRNSKKIIQECFSGLQLDFILEMLTDKKSNQVFTESIQTFASKLYSLSPKAYEYVQSEFKNPLPSPSLVQHWQQMLDSHGLEENKHTLPTLNELQSKDDSILSQNNSLPVTNCVSKNTEHIQSVINYVLDNVCVNER